jgi:hypothetical protein
MPDGRLAVLTTSGNAAIVDAHGRISVLRAPEDETYSSPQRIAVAPDGGLLVAGASSIWKVTGRTYRRIAGLADEEATGTTRDGAAALDTSMRPADVEGLAGRVVPRGR